MSKGLKDEFKQQYPFGYKDYVTEVNASNSSEKMDVVPLELDGSYYLVILPQKNKMKKLKSKRKSPNHDYDEYMDDSWDISDSMSFDDYDEDDYNR